MCGRYGIAPGEEGWASVAEILGSELAARLNEMRPRYNVAPSQQVPIVIEDPECGEAVVVQARWGFVPSWWSGSVLPRHSINARSEEAASKPMWQEALRYHRCLIPATHWYEWQERIGQAKLPHALRPGDGRDFMFAGLSAVWTPEGGQAIRSCAILTRPAAPAIAVIHARMPVVLAPGVWRQWIDRRITDPEMVEDLYRCSATLEVRGYPIGIRINRHDQDDPSLLQPI